MKNLTPVYMSCYCNFKILRSVEGNKINIIHVKVPFDNDVLIAKWAENFRKKYISDSDLIEEMRDRGVDDSFQLLNEIKYPSDIKIKNGDFGEIIVGDFLMYIRNFWVPTLSTRYSDKANKEESTKGSDIIALKFINETGTNSPKDELCICEVKTGSTRPIRGRLQDAINDSDKDDLSEAKRGSMGLSALKLTIKHRGNQSYRKIARFENPIQNPYIIKYLAVAVVDEKHFNEETVKEVQVSKSKHAKKLILIAFSVSEISHLVSIVYGKLGVKNIEN